MHDTVSRRHFLESAAARTFRDANADNLLDSLDLRDRPAFREPPALAAPGLSVRPSACAPGQPGLIPPPAAVTPVR